jgi:intracellular sulfur oxidation DsrE/DsrF family protein
LQGENAVTKELIQLSIGFELQVCPNALREHQIDPATIPPFATTSLGGVVALVLANSE